MNRRKTYVENRRVLADSGEITVPLGVRDPVTAIMLEFRATNGVSGNKAVTMADVVSSVEIIDGSRVLVSLTGHQLFALTAYHLGHIPYELITEVPGNTQNLYGVVQFGRWLGDKVYALDPARFTNLQIRLKWNLAAVRAVGDTGFVTGSLTFTAIADVMEGAPQPQACLTAKQHYSYTSSASGTAYIDLPIDQRIKAVYLRSYSASGGGWYGVANVKVTADQDKFILIDERKSDLQRLITVSNRPFIYKHFYFAKDGDTLYPVLKQDESVSLTPESGDNVAAYLNYGIGNGALDLTVGGSAQNSDVDINGEVQGWMPYGVGCIDLGEYDDPDTWFDPTAYNKVQVQIVQDAASAEASLVIEQEMIY